MASLRALPYTLLVCVTALVGLPLARAADTSPATSNNVADEAWNAHAQTTYVWQGKAPFSAAYSSVNSLSPVREKSYSFTATAFLGLRAWDGGELYFNPEVAQGVPLSNLTGLGGLSNGEIARTAGPTPTFYVARAFLRQTWNLGGTPEPVASDANQLAGSVQPRRVVLSVGKLAVADIFDTNAYSHDPRTQFLNWSLMSAGAYDYAADSRGYSWGAALEWYHDDWVVRGGRFIQPKQPNQLALDPHIFTHYGDQIEVEHSHTLHGQPGKLRLLAFRNRTRMSRFQDALDYAAQHGGTPDINAVRNGEQVKYGFGLNLEQQLSANIGVFARANWADGKTETYAFTEIDNSVAAGAVLQGSLWGRAQDSIGIAAVQNGLSRQRRAYLAAGGLGFFIGDGALNYRPERILETYYSLGLIKGTTLTLDYQYIQNPAYNADRGPVSIGALRLHAAF
jgi:hypothetical protein